MDTTKTTTHLGLCAGYGGIELGLHRVIRNLRTIALCEIEGFACANLVAKMEAGLLDAAPIWTDLKTFPWTEFRDRVDILSGGYPCQPFSAAGKRLGTEDPRHLWPFIADGIRILRPKLCFFENVEGHISLGLREVIGELESIGYTAAWGIFSASEVGAPHQRKRVFILAYRSDTGLQGREWGWKAGAQGESSGYASECGGSMADSILRGMSGSRNELGDIGEAGQGRTHLKANSHIAWPSRPGEPQHRWEPPRVVADSKKPGRISQRIAGDMEGEVSPEGSRGHQLAPTIADCGDAGADAGRQTQPPLGRDSDGASNRMDDAELYTTCDNRTDELRLLGNGVVPAIAERAFRVLMEEIERPIS